MFGEIAGRYDFLNHLLSCGIDFYWRWRTVRLVSPQLGEGPILDVCSGTGDLALAYWKASGGQENIVGADFCHPMLVRGGKKALKAGAEGKISFIEADTMRLPFSDDLFQIVCVAFGLRNVSDTDAGLREMVRVCRAGGVTVVLEFSMPRNPLLKTLYGWYFRYILPRIGQTLVRNTQTAYNYLPASVGEFPQGEALVRRMVAAGLTEVRCCPFTFGIATLYYGKKRV